jgi:hypothetical protein
MEDAIMSSTAATPSVPTPVGSPPPALRLVEPGTPYSTPADAELRRWLVGLGTPFVLGALFFALSVGVTEWLMAPALVLGPMLFMLATIYLCISSDSNAALPPPS